MSNSLQKRRNLVELLYERTLDKKLQWKQTNDDVVKVELGSIQVFISKSRNQNYEDQYDILIYQDQVLKESFPDEQLGASNVSTGIPSVQNYFRLCEALHETASRQASGADEAIDMALTYLFAGE